MIGEKKILQVNYGRGGEESTVRPRRAWKVVQQVGYLCVYGPTWTCWYDPTQHPDFDFLGFKLRVTKARKCFYTFELLQANYGGGRVQQGREGIESGYSTQSREKKEDIPYVDGDNQVWTPQADKHLHIFEWLIYI